MFIIFVDSFIALANILDKFSVLKLIVENIWFVFCALMAHFLHPNCVTARGDRSETN